jgi:hypothetical protein
MGAGSGDGRARPGLLLLVLLALLLAVSVSGVGARRLAAGGQLGRRSQARVGSPAPGALA